MIGVQESKTLFTLLCDYERTFGEIWTDFVSHFPREERFNICCSLALLLEENMLKSSQRLVALFILCQAYSSQQPSLNPFVSFLIDRACDESAAIFERAFILLLFTSASSNDKEVLRQSAADYIIKFNPSSQTFLPREQLQKQYCEGAQAEPYNSIFRNAAVNNALPDPDIPLGCDANSPELEFFPITGSGDGGVAITGMLQTLSLEGLDPKWIRSLPPRLPVFDGELLWLNPYSNHELLWDYGMCAVASRRTKVRDLIAKALKGPLLPARQEEVLVELANDPKLVHHCGLTPLNIPELVEHNPVIAVEVLVKLMNSAEIAKYFTVLLNMDTSLHCMEVVYRLTTVVDIPKEFVHMYISNCISSCADIKDKLTQNRFVRLVCVFIQSLIRNNKINIQDMFVEVEAFCMGFSKVSEAACLFRLLKKYQRDVVLQRACPF